MKLSLHLNDFAINKIEFKNIDFLIDVVHTLPNNKSVF